MKTKFTLSLISVTFLAVLFNSCSIHKRNYRDGYFFDWHASKLDNSNALSYKQPEPRIIAPIVSNTEELVSNQSCSENGIGENRLINSTSDLRSVQKIKEAIRYAAKKDDGTKLKNQIKQTGCDVIILRNGEELEGNVIEVGVDEIKYKKCSEGEKTTYTLLKSKVLSIKYKDGTKDVFTEAESSNALGEGKNQLVALLLCIFLGGLGIHRFYLGHIGMGVLYLLTGGLCGIGWLIDTILILTGDLKPKGGRYDKTL